MKSIVSASRVLDHAEKSIARALSRRARNRARTSCGVSPSLDESARRGRGHRLYRLAAIVDHTRTVKAEFDRQAEAFAASPHLRGSDVTSRIFEALPDGLERILDVACGPGVLTETLCRKARHVVGLDLTPKALAIARDASFASAHAAFVQGSAEMAPFADASFDAAVVRLALHHFEHPVRVLRALRRLRRPDGRVLVLDVLTASDPGVAELHNAIERLRDPSHTTLVTAAALRAQIVNAGYRIVSDTVWHGERSFDDWARVIAEPKRMASLETILRRLARAGVETGIALREREGRLSFTYQFGMYVAAPTADTTDDSR
jgi:ubiquinone/menaquinone biosynthesis C-methylase UbiE